MGAFELVILVLIILWVAGVVLGTAGYWVHLLLILAFFLVLLRLFRHTEL